MFGLIKLIFGLLILTGLVVYGGDIWNTAKEKIGGFSNPELQKASILENIKDNYERAKNIINELGQSESGFSSEQKAKLEEAAKLIEESKSNLGQLEKNNSSFTEKVFENANDLKEGVQNLFSDQLDKSTQDSDDSTQNCQCSLEK